MENRRISPGKAGSIVQVFPLLAPTASDFVAENHVA
jgi:hypothetical protein